jgi:hypothetical protein
MAMLENLDCCKIFNLFDSFVGKVTFLVDNPTNFSYQLNVTYFKTNRFIEIVNIQYVLRLVFEHEYFLGWAVCPLMTSFFVSFH